MYISREVAALSNTYNKLEHKTMCSVATDLVIYDIRIAT